MELSRNSIGTLAFYLFFLGTFWGQTLPTNWGPMEPRPGALLDIFPIRSGDFYTLRFSGGVLGNFRVALHNQLGIVGHQRLKSTTENGFGDIESGVYFGKQLHVFISDRYNGTMGIYRQSIDELETNEPPVLLCSYQDLTLGAKPNFQFSLSQNGQYLAVYYEVPGKKENRDLYGYRIYDSTFREIQKGEYMLPFDGNMTTINQHHITNFGDYLLVITEHKDRNDRFWGREWENFKAMHVYEINQDSLKEYQVDLQDKRIDDILISSNDHKHVSMTGLYGRGSQSGVEGVFTINLNLSNDEISKARYTVFNTEILQESRSAQQADRMERRWEARGENPQIYSYKLRQIQTLENGSQLGYMEQYYERRFTNYDSRTGITTVNSYYYYMDIALFKMDSAGNYLWGKRIPKDQISMNDNGPYSSFIGCNNEQNAYLIFNDNKRNYDEEGRFSQSTNEIYGLNLSNRKNVVALVKVNLKTGEIERNTLFSRKELSAIVVPKLMKVDWINKELLLYAINNNREKFGIVSFK